MRPRPGSGVCAHGNRTACDECKHEEDADTIMAILCIVVLGLAGLALIYAISTVQ